MALDISELLNYGGNNYNKLDQYRLNQTYNNVDGYGAPTFGTANGANFLGAPQLSGNPVQQGGPGSSLDTTALANTIIQNAQNNAGGTALPTQAGGIEAQSGAAPTTAQPVQTVTPVQQSQPVLDAATLRAQALGLVDQNFGVNYGERNISESFLDDTINNLLTEQQNNAQSYLDRGKARGIYNDIGYDAGRNTIANSADAGRSSLADLARGVLDKYQSRANTVRDTAYNAATSVDENRPFKIDPYLEQGNQVISDAQKYASGDLKGAFGNTQLFDFGALNNKAGQAQGALNLRDTDLATAVKERNRRDSQSRGIGNTGAF